MSTCRAYEEIKKGKDKPSKNHPPERHLDGTILGLGDVKVCPRDAPGQHEEPTKYAIYYTSEVCFIGADANVKRHREYSASDDRPSVSERFGIF